MNVLRPPLTAPSYLVPFLSQEEVADISVLDPASAHVELIERNNVLREVVSNTIIRSKLTADRFLKRQQISDLPYHQPQSPCSALRAQAICRAQAPCTHALTDLLSPMNQPSPLDDSCGSLCFRYCHVLLSIVFQVYLFSGFQFFKYYG